MGKKVITSIGLGTYRSTRYYIVKNQQSENEKGEKVQEDPVETPFIAEAISKFYPDFKEYYFLLTNEAKDGEPFKRIKKLLESEGINTYTKRIQMGKNKEDIWHAFDALNELFEPNDEIIFDITHAFRSIPVYITSLIRFFQVVRGVRIKTVLYGAFEAKDENSNSTPVFDLTPIIEVYNWTDSVTDFLHYDDSKKLTDLLKKYTNSFNKSKGLAMPFKKINSQLNKFSKYILLSNSQKVSEGSRDIIKTLQEIEKKSAKGGTPVLPPPLIELLNKVHNELEEFSGVKEKFNKDLIERDIFLVKHYAKKSLYQQALTLLRELMIDYVLFAWKGELPINAWLDREIRQKAEAFLGVIDFQRGAGVKFLIDNEQEQTSITHNVSSLFKTIANWRNMVNHAGRNKNSDEIKNILKNIDYKLEEMIKEFEDLLNNEEVAGVVKELLDVQNNDLPVLLITPLGLSRGLLYTALKKVNPANLLVITTDSITNDIINEVMEKAEKDIPYQVFRLKDPFNDFNSWRDLVKKESFIDLVRGKELVFNITGGTTALQYNIQKIHEYFRHNVHFIPVKSVVCIDKRPIQEQRANPYVVGEMEVLKDE